MRVSCSLGLLYVRRVERERLVGLTLQRLVGWFVAVQCEGLVFADGLRVNDARQAVHRLCVRVARPETQR